MKITIWNGRYATAKTEFETTRDGFVKWLESAGAAPFPDKMACPLISLGEYGDKRSDNDALRNAENLRATWGVELDYDGADTSIDVAAERLRAAGMGAVLVTTATPGRWRAFLPSDRPLTLAERTEIAERANGVVGGSLAHETFSAVQAWFVGAVQGAEYRVIDVPGALPLGREDLPRIGWKGRAREDGGTYTPTEALWGEIEDGNELHAAICALAYRGVGEAELVEAVTRAAPGWTRPDREKRLRSVIASDIPRAVKSAEAKRVKALEARLQALGPPPPAPAPRPKLFTSWAALTAKWTPIEWLVRGIIEHPAFVVMFGPPEQGKSFLSIDLACSVASGRAWHGARVLSGPVVYLAGEGFVAMKRRFRAWQIARGVSDAEMQRLANRMVISDRAVNVMDSSAFEAMCNEVEAAVGRPVLVVVDTLNRMTPGMDENSAKDMSNFVQRCDVMKERWHATVLVVHHSGTSDETRVRGSSALKGSTDVEIAVKLDKSANVMTVSNTKMKEAQRFDPMFFALDDVPLPGWYQDAANDPNVMPELQSSASLRKLDEAPAKKEKRPSQAVILIRDIVRGAGRDGISKKDMLAKFVELRGGAGNEKTKANKFYEAFNKCREDGWIILDDTRGVFKEPF